MFRQKLFIRKKWEVFSPEEFMRIILDTFHKFSSESIKTKTKIYGQMARKLLGQTRNLARQPEWEFINLNQWELASK